jgi:hypothetical protein
VEERAVGKIVTEEAVAVATVEAVVATIAIMLQSFTKFPIAYKLKARLAR